MRLKVFCVCDSKVGAFMPPFTVRSKGEALRGWQDLVNDGQSAISKFPADFTLFEIGEFDDETGCLVPHEAKISVGTALEYKIKPVETLAMFDNIKPVVQNNKE